MKPGRMAAHEAPRTVPPGREMRYVVLLFRGGRHTNGRVSASVAIPKALKPDLIRYRGHIFMRRGDDQYTEASMWPVLEALDGHGR